MRRLLAVAALAALPALAQSPGEFASRVELTPTGADALQRFALPFEVYRDARRDLADVRVFNARGEPVPIALAAEPEASRETPRTVPLAHFAVSRITTTPDARGAEVTVRTSDGTLVAVRGGRGGSKALVPVAYLVDASQVKEPLQGLVFEWDAAPGTEVAHIAIEASDDLQAWRPLGHASLVRLASGGRVLEQPRARFTATKARYYRVTWSGNALTVRGVQGEFEPEIRRAPRLPAPSFPRRCRSIARGFAASWGSMTISKRSSVRSSPTRRAGRRSRCRSTSPWRAAASTRREPSSSSIALTSQSR